MNDISGGVLNLGSSTNTNAHAIVLSDNQVKINAPYSNPDLIKPAMIITDISVNIFTPGTSNPAISVDASRTTITILDVSAETVRRLDASSAYITNLDVSNATIANLVFSAASVNSLDASNGVITYLDVSSATVRRLDASSAYITNLDVSNATIANLVFSAASVNSLDASNGVITYLDVSSATFKRLDASAASIDTLHSTNATVSAGLYAKAALIGDNTNTSDPSQNFVFIQAPAGQTFGRVRGPNLSTTGTLKLGANSNSLSNIVLNADGTTTINGLSGETVGRIRGPDLSNCSLQLGANRDSSSNIVLNADRTTTIPSLVISNPIQPTYSISVVNLNIERTATTFYSFIQCPDINGLWYCGIEPSDNSIESSFSCISTMYYFYDHKIISGGSAVSGTKGDNFTPGITGNYTIRPAETPRTFNFLFFTSTGFSGVGVTYKANFIQIMGPMSPYTP